MTVFPGFFPTLKYPVYILGLGLLAKVNVLKSASTLYRDVWHYLKFKAQNSTFFKNARPGTWGPKSFL